MRWASLVRQAVQAGAVYRRPQSEVYALAASPESIGPQEIYVDTQGTPVRRASTGPGAVGGAWVEDRLVLYVRESRGYAGGGLEVEATAVGLCAQLLSMNVPVVGFSWEWERDVAAHNPGGSLDTSVARITVDLAE